MTRLPRLALLDLPYHVTQRGNRRQPVFFCEADRHLYLALLREHASHFGLEVWENREKENRENRGRF